MVSGKITIATLAMPSGGNGRAGRSPPRSCRSPAVRCAPRPTPRARTSWAASRSSTYRCSPWRRSAVVRKLASRSARKPWVLKRSKECRHQRVRRPLSFHRQDDLADMVASFHPTVRVGRVGEREGAVDHRLQLAVRHRRPDRLNSTDRGRSVDPVNVRRRRITSNTGIVAIAPPCTAIETWRPSSARHCRLRAT